jgi:hypothetical protein
VLNLYSMGLSATLASTAYHPLHQQDSVGGQHRFQLQIFLQGGGAVAEVIHHGGVLDSHDGMHFREQLANKWGHGPQCGIQWM